MLYYPLSRSGRFDIDPIPLQSAVVGGVVALNVASFLTGSTPAVTWSVTGGSLPPGVFLSAAGVVSGTITGGGGNTVATIEANAGAFGVAAQALAFSIPILATTATDRDAIFSGGTTRTWTYGGVAMVASDLLVSGTFAITRSGWVGLIGAAAGGGGGSVNNLNGSSPGGGGAGQYLETRIFLEVGTYTVTIGAAAPAGTNGNSTTITGPNGFSITLAGGGGGAGAYTFGRDGASGGGGAWNSAANPGGAATSVDTGNSGGASHTTNAAGGGGGGFGTPGEIGNATRGGSGGGGVRKKLWAWLDFCGGGGGGSNAAASTGRNGGGNGGTNGTNGGAATANTGSGGGGAGLRTSGGAVLVGGASGSGRVIVWARQTT